MSNSDKKLSPGIILPVLLVLGVFFGLAGFIFNIPAYIEVLSTKVTYPTSYEFKIYDRLLKKYVSNGLLDYRSVKRDPELDACYLELKQTNPDNLKGKLEQLSFWINTYNLLTIKCIADSYPINCLRQESAVKRFIVGAKLYSLNQIKEEVLPPLISSSDWRAIFLICNGSISAPFIAEHAYSASRIGDDFEPAMKRFVLCQANYSYDEKQKMFSISPFYRANLRYIDQVYPSPFDMVNDQLPRGKQVDLEQVFRNYAMPYDWRINDIAWLKKLQNSQETEDKDRLNRADKNNFQAKDSK